jgi:IS5 family transposase
MAGRSPVDRGKQGTKRSIVVDGAGIPLGVVQAPANRNDSPLLASTLDSLADRALPPGETTVHLDRGYDSGKTRTELDRRGMASCIAKLGKPAPLRATSRWVVERTNAWHNAFKKLAWCTERRGMVIRFYVALANAIIIVRRLVREAWKRYRWDTRPKRCP